MSTKMCQSVDKALDSLPHEPPVDAILDAPEPGPLEDQPPLGGHAVLVTLRATMHRPSGGPSFGASKSQQ